MSEVEKGETSVSSVFMEDLYTSVFIVNTQTVSDLAEIRILRCS